MKLGQSTWI